MKDGIKAYFISWCYPAEKDPTRNHSAINTQNINGVFKEIYRSYDWTTMNANEHIELLRIVLQDYFERDFTFKEAESMFRIPGHDFMRITPEELERFLPVCNKQLSFIN